MKSDFRVSKFGLRAMIDSLDEDEMDDFDLLCVLSILPESSEGAIEAPFVAAGCFRHISGSYSDKKLPLAQLSGRLWLAIEASRDLPVVLQNIRFTATTGEKARKVRIQTNSSDEG